jgi:hypothetical protein
MSVRDVIFSTRVVALVSLALLPLKASALDRKPERQRAMWSRCRTHFACSSCDPAFPEKECKHKRGLRLLKRNLLWTKKRAARLGRV